MHFHQSHLSFILKLQISAI